MAKETKKKKIFAPEGVFEYLELLKSVPDSREAEKLAHAMGIMISEIGFNEAWTFAEKIKQAIMTGYISQNTADKLYEEEEREAEEGGKTAGERFKTLN